jgi:hypothetical protein
VKVSPTNKNLAFKLFTENCKLGVLQTLLLYYFGLGNFHGKNCENSTNALDPDIQFQNFLCHFPICKCKAIMHFCQRARRRVHSKITLLAHFASHQQKIFPSHFWRLVKSGRISFSTRFSASNLLTSERKACSACYYGGRTRC